MEERDDLGTVGSGSESTTVTAGVDTVVDETLVENSNCGSDRVEEDGGGEIMVEVVGSDVFVDGVRGHEGGEGVHGEREGEEPVKEGEERDNDGSDGEKGDGVGEDLKSEVGGEEPVKEGEERENDGSNGGSGHEGGENLKGEIGGEESVKEGEEREIDPNNGESGGIGDLGDQLGNGGSEIGDESIQRTEGSLNEQIGVVVEDTGISVNREGLERDGGSVGVGVGGEVDLVGVSDSQETRVSDKEGRDSGIETVVGDSLEISEASREETEVVTEKAVVMVNEEGTEKDLAEEGVEREMESVHGVVSVLDDSTSQKINVKDDEVWNPGIESTSTPSLMVVESLTVETLVSTEEVTTLVVSEEDLNPKDEITGVEISEANSTPETVCSEPDRDGNVNKNDGFSDQQAKDMVEVEAAVMNEEETLHSQVEEMKTDSLDGSCLLADQQTKVEIVCQSVENHCDIGSDLVSSSEPSKDVIDGKCITVDDKLSSDSTVKTPEDINSGGVGEAGVDFATIESDEGKVSNSNAEIEAAREEEVAISGNGLVGVVNENIDHAEDQPRLNEQTEIVNNHEVTTTDSVISNSKVEVVAPDETTTGDGGKDDTLRADLESSHEHACSTDNAEFAPMDIDETFDIKDEDQHLKADTLEKVDGTSLDDVVQGTVVEGENRLNSETEVLDEDACRFEEDGNNQPTVSEGAEKDGLEKMEIDIHVASSKESCPGKVEIPVTLEGNTSLPDKEEELEHGTDQKIVVENNVVGKDSSVVVDSSATGDEKQEPVVQLAETQTHGANVDESLNAGGSNVCTHVPDVVASHEVVNRDVESKYVTCEKNDATFDNCSTVGTLVVDLDNCINEDRTWKSEGDALAESISFPDVEFHLSESLDGSASGNFSWDASNESQEPKVEEQNTGTETVNLHGEQEMEIGQPVTDAKDPEGVEEKISVQSVLEPGSFERVNLASSFASFENENEFSVSDLVWGKVRSHPWWPGQIFDPLEASEKATKYHKKDCFLVAYFGDRTFAWNEAHLLKPFWTHFSEVEKHSNSEAFHNAVGCALEEVSRRVELGLACSCLPKDAYEKIEYQTVENTGVRQELSRRYGMDRSTGVSSFEPNKLLEYIRTLAQSPSVGGDRLELVIAKAQLLAVSRLKGFCQLPEFQFCGGGLEYDTDTSQLGVLKTAKSSSGKRKHNLKEIKKEKSLSDLGDVAYSPDGQDGSDGNAMSKSVSLSSGRKRKAIDSTDAEGAQDKRISIYAAKVSTTASPIPKPSFKIGECIRRVASQLTGPRSILKSSGEKIQKADGRGEKDAGFDDSLQLDELLSQLHLTARDALKGYSFLNTIITFFSGFRNSVVASQYSARQTPSGGRLGGGRKRKASHSIAGTAEEFEFDDVNDSYWTDMIIQNNEEEQPLGNGHKEGIYQPVTLEPDKSIKPTRRPYSRKRFSNGGHEWAMEEPIGNIEVRKNNLPTELILNFSGGDPVPSEMNLNKIFKRFGPLKESETEIDSLANRARVVFKKCSDAEVAFGSAGKFNIFGPVLVNYELSYEPSLSFRTLPLETLQGDEDAI